LTQVFGQRAAIGFTGATATKSRFMAEAKRSSVFFLAAHAWLDGENPLSSFFALTPDPGQPDDGRLTASDIRATKMPDRLALLLACDTERGRIVEGEGEIGLAWAFLQGGCPAAIVSQWSVDLEATVRLSSGFLERLHQTLSQSPKSSFSIAELLRESELELLQDNRFNHPFYWAGFVLVGDEQWQW
jgi:CHAT domain-containing protein